MRTSNFALRPHPSLLAEARRTARGGGRSESTYQCGGGGEALCDQDGILFPRACAPCECSRSNRDFGTDGKRQSPDEWG